MESATPPSAHRRSRFICSAVGCPVPSPNESDMADFAIRFFRTSPHGSSSGLKRFRCCCKLGSHPCPANLLTIETCLQQHDATKNAGPDVYVRAAPVKTHTFLSQAKTTVLAHMQRSSHPVRDVRGATSPRQRCGLAARGSDQMSISKSTRSGQSMVGRWVKSSILRSMQENPSARSHRRKPPSATPPASRGPRRGRSRSAASCCRGSRNRI